MLEHLDRLNEDRASLASPELSEADIDADISTQEGDMLADLERFSSAIGKRLGQMHQVLAQANERPDFAPEEADDSICNQWITEDRKSTRLNSSHVAISYAVFCLKKKLQTHCESVCMHFIEKK